MAYVILQINGLNPNSLTEKKIVSINGHIYNNTPIKYGVPKGSVLGPILFLIYINYFNPAVTFCENHHFAGDTKILA